MTKDTQSQTADGNSTNSHFNLKKEFLGNILIMSTLLTMFVELVAGASNNFRSGYQDIAYNTWCGDSLIKCYDKINKENKERASSASATLENDTKEMPQGSRALGNGRENSVVLSGNGSGFLC